MDDSKNPASSSDSNSSQAVDSSNQNTGEPYTVIPDSSSKDNPSVSADPQSSINKKIPASDPFPSEPIVKSDTESLPVKDQISTGDVSSTNTNEPPSPSSVEDKPDIDLDGVNKAQSESQPQTSQPITPETETSTSSSVVSDSPSVLDASSPEEVQTPPSSSAPSAETSSNLPTPPSAPPVEPPMPTPPVAPPPSSQQQTPPSVVSPTAPPIVVAKSNKGIMILISLLVVLGIIGGAVYFFWDGISSTVETYISGPQPTATPTPSPAPQTSQPTPEPTLASQVQAPVNPNISRAHNQFGFNLFDNLRTKDPTQNLLLSPSSVGLALSMVYNGANSETKTSIGETLQYTGMTDDQINQYNKQLIEYLEAGDPDVQLDIANSIWGKEGVNFEPEFLVSNQKNYMAEIKELDFSLPTAANTINSWVKQKTVGKIPTIVQSPIDPSVMMYLINALYFKGSWTNEFDPALTVDKEFTNTKNQTEMKPFMTQERNDFKYLENDSFQAVKLPYGKNQNFQMYIFLPKNSIDIFLAQLSYEKWNTWKDSFASANGKLMLPRFRVQYEETLTSALSVLGMNLAFSDQADFSNISKSMQLQISKVLHKTYMDVNEVGTEAAAVTAVEVSATTDAEPLSKFVMDVNKPFFIVLADEQTDEILFLGRIAQP